MTGWQRSNILVREEKGIAAVSFKRLLMAGGGGAMVAMVGSRLVGFAPACLGAVVILVVVLVITHPIEGLALANYAIRTLRGWITLAAIHSRGGILRTLGRAMRIAPDEGILQADRVYDAIYEDQSPDTLLDEEWAYLGGFSDVDDEGLAAVDDPFEESS